MPASDLTPRQFSVLVAISANEGLSQTEAVELTGVDRSTMADLIRRLLKKGYLRRHRARKDARAYAVSLTEKGWLALRDTVPAAERADARLLAALPTKDAELFLRALSIVSHACQFSEPDKSQ
jgi:DNA-binding MarR family transcriptional regulator